MSYYRVEAGEARELRQLLTAAGDVAGIRGFSVTMPGKQAALELADMATERALSIGTANTLVPHVEEHSALGEPSGMEAPANETRRVNWLADNTDVDGVTRCLEYVVAQGALDLSGTSAVVIGNGGTARPAVAALATGWSSARHRAGSF